MCEVGTSDKSTTNRSTTLDDLGYHLGYLIPSIVQRRSAEPRVCFPFVPICQINTQPWNLGALELEP